MASLPRLARMLCVVLGGIRVMLKGAWCAQLPGPEVSPVRERREGMCIWMAMRVYSEWSFCMPCVREDRWVMSLSKSPMCLDPCQALGNMAHALRMLAAAMEPTWTVLLSNLKEQTLPHTTWMETLCWMDQPHTNHADQPIALTASCGKCDLTCQKKVNQQLPVRKTRMTEIQWNFREDGNILYVIMVGVVTCLYKLF